MQLDGANNTGEGNFQDRDTWTDLSGNNKNGVINGATWNGNSLVFDGVNDWVNCDLSNTDYKTLEATFCVDSLSTLPQAVIGNWDAGGGGISIHSNGYIVGEYCINSAYRTITSPVKVEVGKVYHVALTYNGTTVILYVNGVEQGKITNSGTIGEPINSTVMALGTNPSGISAQGSYLKGKIYSARIYDRALTDDEVKKNCVSDQVLVNGKMLKTAYVDNLEYTFTWDEEIDEFTSSKINVVNGTKGTFTQVTKNKVYKLVVGTPDGGIVKVSVPEGVCKDSLETASIASEIKSIEIDKIAPTYTSIEVKNVTTTGYDVYVYGVTDNYSGISRVQFPTWTESNGQDDIQADWQTSETAKGTMQEDGTTWVYRVNVTDHNNEYGDYNTHIYLYDNLGNCTNIEADNKVVAVPGVNLTYLSGNLLYGLGDDVAETTASSGRMKYSIENYAVTVTALTSDGFGLTPGRVYLEAGKTYRFSCDSTGDPYTDGKIEAFFMLNRGNSCYLRMANNKGYEFTPTQTGTYWLRLDVNTSGETHTFSNIQVYEVTKKETKGYAAKLGTLPTLTREGYVFNGWFTEKTGGTKISSDTAVPESDITYYAQWTEKNYQNTTTSVYYETLKSALDNVATGQTIKVLNSRTEREVPELASKKTVTIDTNGQTTTLNGVTLTNNGILTISGSGKITGTSTNVIVNNGTLKVGEGVIIAATGADDFALVNYGILSLNNSIINSEYRGINNYENGKVTISGGTIATKSVSVLNYGSANTESAPAIKITGDSNITSNGGNAISNEAIGLIHIDGGIINTQTGGAPTVMNCADGKILITSGTINCSGTNAAVYNGYNSGNAVGTVEIRGGTIETSTADGVNNQEKGNVIISGGTITSNKCAVINRSTGKVTISGGTIKSTAGDTIQNRVAGGTTEITSGTIISDSMAAVAISAGTIKVTGGSLEGKTFGIWNNAGTVIVGDNSNAVNITSPSIIGKTTAGVRVGSGTFNFYDGIIMGPSGKSIDGTVSEPATGCVVVKGTKTIDNVTYETSVLGPSAPVITAKLTNANGAAYTGEAWTNKNVWVLLASADIGAGIKEYQWYENGAWTTRGIWTRDNIGTITYDTTKNITLRVRAVDNNNVISAESSIDLKIDKTLPTITVSPASATVCKSKSVTITVADTGGSELSSSNSYQYYLSSSSTALDNGKWTDYTSGTAFTIGTGITGTRYLFVRRVSDNAGNVSTANGTATTISGTTYQRFGSYVFDNTAPTVLINTESMYVTDGIVTRLDGVNNANESHNSSATTWSDISGNGKNGTVTSGTWGANYLDFNGSSTWVDLGVMNSNYQTIEVTFSPDTVPTSSQYIIGNWTWKGGGGGIGIHSTGEIFGEYYIGGSWQSIISKVKVVANQKYHVAVTYNGTTVILYVNGVEQGRISVSGTIEAPTTVMGLGSIVETNGGVGRIRYFDGKIYNAGVYNKALTAAQVKTNADAGKALAGGPTNASSITYTMRFSENVTGFTTDDITITNGTKGTFATVTSGRVFTVAVTTAASQNNTQTIALAANGCTDAAGNGLAATNKTVVIDRVAPTVTLSTNGGTYNIAPGKTTVSISTTLTAADTGSGAAGLGYAWATSNSSQPSTWTVFTSGTAISASRSGGNSYIWTNVIDNAGNRATSVLTSSAFVVRYQVVFNANGGSGAPGTQYKVHGTTLTLSSTKPTRTGYTFKEWNTKSDGTGTSYAAGASYTANSAVTLYAIWIEVPSAPVITAKLTNASGATYTSGTWTNKDIYISLESANKGAGIKEYQWKEGSSGTWQAINNSDGTGTWSAERNSTIYFRAVDTNGGISAESSIDMKIDKTAPTTTVPTATATTWSITVTNKQTDPVNTKEEAVSGIKTVQYAYKKGSTWSSWQSSNVFSKDGGIFDGKQYTIKTKVTDNAGNSSESAEATINTASHNYTITYNLNGGSVSSNPSTYTGGVGTTINAPTKLGYTFSGWSRKFNMKSRASGFINIDTGKIEASSRYPNSYYSCMYYLSSGVTYTINTTYTGGIRWRAYDLNGNYTGNVSETKTYTPTSNCYVRILFYEAPTTADLDATTITIGGASTSATISANCRGYLEYTANWKANTATITINKNGSAWSDSGINVALYSGTTSKYAYSAATVSGSTVKWSAVAAGTYNVYASTRAGAATTLVDTGVDVTVSATGTATVNYYVLTKTQGTGTTLTIRETNSSGTAIGTSAILSGRTIYVAASANTGYRSLSLTVGGSAFTSGNTKSITAATEVKSSATENTYTIAFNANGGSGTMSSITGVKYTTSTTLTQNKFTRTGYTFAGWATSATGSKAYNDKAQVSKLNATNGATVTLYAVWTANTYKVTVNPNGGTYNNTTSNTTISGNYDTGKNIGTPSAPAGYKVTFNGNGATSPAAITSTKSFTGWTKSGTGEYVGASSAATGTMTRTEKFENGERYENFKYTANSPTANTWYSLKYPAYTYTSGSTYEIRLKVRVNSVANGGNITFRHSALANDWGTSGLKTYGFSAVTNGWKEVVLTRTITGTTTTLSGNTVKIAPVFEAYTSNLKNTTASIDFDVKDVMIINKSTEKLLQSNANLFWFRAGNGTLTANYSNNSITLPSISRTGYTFNGWYTSNGTKVGGAGDKYTPTANIELSAQWTANTYTIAYTLNGGTSGTNAPTSGTYGSTVQISNPTRTGYTFAGWTSSTSAGLASGATSGTATNPTTSWTGGSTKNTYFKNLRTTSGTVTLTATWTANVYKITLNNQSATTAGSTAVYEKYATGIYKESGCTTAMTTSANAITKPSRAYTVTFNYNGNGTANTTATATWTFGGYYTSTGGNGTQRIGANGYITSNFANTSYTANGTLYAKWTGGTVSLPSPTRTGYTFAGWYTAASGGTQIKLDTQITSSQTVFAHWTSNVYTMTLNNANATTKGSTAVYEKYGVGIYKESGCTTKMTTTTNAITIPKREYTITFDSNGGSSCNSIKSTYTFKGYYRSTSSSSPQMINGNGFITTNFSTTASASNITLYALWSGGLITLPTPTRTGYRFDGWCLNESDDNGTGNPVSKNSNYTPTATRTLYAKWTQYEALETKTSTYYDTLQDAIDAYKGRAANIQLQKSVTYTTSIQMYAADIATIDLNGYTITSSADYVIYLNNVGPGVNIKNGSIHHTNTTISNDKGCIKYTFGGASGYSSNVTVTSVNLTSDYGVGIRNEGGHLEIKNGTMYTYNMCIDNNVGTVNINGTSEQTTSPNMQSTNNYTIASYDSDNVVNIYSGILKGGILSAGGTVNLGTTELTATKTYPRVIGSSKIPLTTSGGRIYFNAGGVTHTTSTTWKSGAVYIRSGYTTKSSTYGSSGVTIKLVASTSTTSATSAASAFSLRSASMAINTQSLQEETNEENSSGEIDATQEADTIKQAKIGNVEYTDLVEALANAKNGEEIVLLEDIMLKDKITVLETTNAKINLNGHKVESETGEILENNGIIQIIDTSGGKIVGKITNYKDLEIKGGTIVDKEKLDEEDKTEFDASDTEAILARKVKTIDNQKGNLTLSGGNVENNSNEGIVIYNSKDGNVVLKTGKLIANGSKAIGILNKEGKVGLNIDEKLIKEASGEEVKEPEITLSGLNSIGIYNIGENAYLELQHGIITAKTTIIGNITKILEGYIVREEEIEAMMQLTLVKEEV